MHYIYTYADFEVVLVSADKTVQEYDETLSKLHDMWYAKVNILKTQSYGYIIL